MLSGNRLKASVHFTESVGCRFKATLNRSLVLLSDFLCLLPKFVRRFPGLVSHPLGFLHVDLLLRLYSKRSRGLNDADVHRSGLR